jgi:CIC family chloride channel protein
MSVAPDDRPGWARRRAELLALASRSREVVVLAALTGGVTGLGVALFERVTVDALFERVTEASPWLLAFMPFVGLVLAALALRYLARTGDPGTADAYLRAYHSETPFLRLREVPGRMIGAVATLGSGGAMGLEGPSLYLGASTGSFVQRRLAKLVPNLDRRTLLVAGAAAGVGAIFKAPATGAVFALEVPYQDDLARRMLLPSLVGAASGYLTYVAINGTTRVLPVRGSPPFSLADLGGAVVLGIAAGISARGFAWLIRRAKTLVATTRARWRVPACGLVIAACFGVAHAATEGHLVIGPGYHTLAWTLDPTRAAWLVALVLLLRGLATGATVAGGGVGGLFIPLVVMGALLGRLASIAVGETETTLFVIVGVAAFLGAGYRVPLAAVMFVAETTGRAGFVVPGVLAAVAAELVMGSASVTAYQRVSRMIRPGSRSQDARDPTDE